MERSAVPLEAGARMRLARWKCGKCGFEWFEPNQATEKGQSIDHGCPQGCDDAGRVIGKVEAAVDTEKWICWTLSKEDMDKAAERLGKNQEKLTEMDYEEIIRHFKSGLLWQWMTGISYWMGLLRMHWVENGWQMVRKRHEGILLTYDAIYRRWSELGREQLFQ